MHNKSSANKTREKYWMRKQDQQTHEGQCEVRGLAMFNGFISLSVFTHNPLYSDIIIICFYYISGIMIQFESEHLLTGLFFFLLLNIRFSAFKNTECRTVQPFNIWLQLHENVCKGLSYQPVFPHFSFS